MSPRIVDKNVKKDEILQAAFNVYCEKGLSKTRMADIALAANIGKGTIYEYFRSRDEIFLECMKKCNQDMASHVEEQVSEIENPIERVARSLKVIGESIQGTDDKVLSVNFEMWVEAAKEPELAEKSKEIFKEGFGSFYDFLCASYQEAIDKDLLKKIEIDSIARLTMSFVDGAVFHAISLNEKEMLSDWFDRFFKLIIQPYYKGAL
jgi:AcrR family transcriptional regulator